MRCFPYASDIGSVINIQTIAAVALERTNSNPIPSRTDSISMNQSRSQIQAQQQQQLYYQSQLHSSSPSTIYNSYPPQFFHPSPPFSNIKPFHYPILSSPPPPPPRTVSYPFLDLKNYYSVPGLKNEGRGKLRGTSYEGDKSMSTSEGEVFFFPAIGA